MGCTCEAHYVVRGNFIVREMRIFEDNRLASESVTVTRLPAGLG